MNATSPSRFDASLAQHFIAQHRHALNREENFRELLDQADLYVNFGHTQLGIIAAYLARAETLVQQQPLLMGEAQQLVTSIRALRATLRQVSEVIDTWDESEVCLRATGGEKGGDPIT